MLRILRNLFLAFLVCFYCVLPKVTQAQNSGPVPGITLPGAAPGSPGGSYALTGFDKINLFNGHLNVQIPILTIGGRGEAGYTMNLPLQPNFFAAFNPQNGTYSAGPSWSPPGSMFTPGVLEMRSEYQQEGSFCPGYDAHGFSTLTRLVFIDADGTEHALIDTTTSNGVATYGVAFGNVECPGSNPPDRGFKFLALDGSGIAFLSNATIYDSPYANSPLNGQLYFRDGRAYEITGGLVTAIRDRNGNLVLLQYENQGSLGTQGDTATHRLVKVTDPIGRDANIMYPPLGTLAGCTIITYQQKRYQLCSQPLGTQSEVQGDFQNLNPPQTAPNTVINTIRSDFVSSNGTSRETIQAMLQASGLAIDTTNLWTPEVFSFLTFPNSQSYYFLYNPIGEISQITVPTGGAILYDFSFAPGVTPSGYSQPQAVLGAYPNYTIYRRLTSRRVLKNATDSVAEQWIDYSKQTVGSSEYVLVNHKDGIGNILQTEEHDFFSAPEFETGANYVQPFGYPNWNDSIETLTKQFSPSTSGSLTLVNRWAQQALPAAIANQLSRYPGSIPPPYNPRITQIYKGIDGANSAQAYCYDDTQTFNNQTDVYEYFGVVSLPAGCPGPSSGYFRHTHTDYLTDPIYTSDTVHLLGLPVRRRIMDANDNMVAETDYTYDSALNSASSIIGHLTTVATITNFPAFDLSYATRGNVTGVSRYVSPGNWVNTSASYDIAGNVVTAKDGNQNQTTFNYTDAWGGQGSAWGGTPASTLPMCNPSSPILPCAQGPQSSTQAFPTTVTNALKQSTTTMYAYNAGRPVTVTDANVPPATTSYDYSDYLQRLHSITYPVGGPTTYVYKDTPGNVTVSEIKSFGIPSGSACSNPALVYSEAVYDGLGREISRKSPAADNWAISVDTAYDSLGRVYQVSNPYEYAPNGSTTYTYDALDRVLTVTGPDNSLTRTSYSSDPTNAYVQTVITDAANNTSTSYTDGLGRLVRVIAQGPASVSGQSYTIDDYTTNYIYNVIDNLTQVLTSQPSRNRTFSYDGLGRLSSASNPENGLVQYSLYDGNGNLKTKIANGVTTSFVYDPLDRLTQRSYDDGITPTVNYAYDQNETHTYPIGRLGQVSTVNVVNAPAASTLTVSTTYVSYDALGRVTASRQNLGNQAYPFTYTYNDQTLDSITYPSQRRVEYCYDAAAHVQEVKNLTQPNLPSYATGVQYHPAGGISQMTLGNGVLETRNYNSRLQVTQIQAGTPLQPGSLLALGYDYGTANNNGNVLSQTITRGTQTWTQSYGYTDGLNRLTSAQESGAGIWSQIYDYDPWANRWLDPASSGLPVDPFTPQFPSNFDPYNRLILQGSSYDPNGNGNLTGIGSNMYTYDAENRMIGAYQGMNSTALSSTGYVYDGDGRRVQKITCPAGTNPCNGASTGATFTTYVYDAMGQLAAEYGTATDTGTNYVTTDHLGSTRLVTDITGASVRCYDYLPFGEEIAANAAGRTPDCFTSTTTSDADHAKFTGKERDAETGLDWFNVRYYAGPQGRFTSPDQPFIDQDPSNPQSWNLYNYGRNNPLRYVDPTGRECVDLGNGQYGDDGQGTLCDKADFTPYTVQAYDYYQQGGNVYVNGQIVYEAALENDFAADFGLLGLIRGAFGGLLGGAVAQSAGPGLFDLAPIARGNAIERALGANLSKTFPTIDKFINGVATSIKSVDLRAATYQNPANLARTLTNYVDKVAEFQGRAWGPVTIRGAEITGRVLEVAVPEGAIAPAQQAAINSVVSAAAQKGVQVILIPIR